MEEQRFPSRRSEFRNGANDTFPLVVGAIPFGVIFGALAVASRDRHGRAAGLAVTGQAVKR